MSVHAVLYSWLSRDRIVLLKENQGERFLPIWIGQAEAEAIALRLQGTAVPRPMTHDLLLNMIEELTGKLRYVVVNDLNNNTFYAGIAVDHDSEVQLVDSRPSDAIALAVRAEAPIFVEQAVLDKAGIVSAPDLRGAAARSDDLGVFRDFVDTLDLGDLGN
ncbi:MAG: bifunctional nuclease family protein [Chloroflexota bacterium]